MENVQREKASRSRAVKEARPDIKDLAKEFLSKVTKLSQAQKVNMLYSMITNSKPSPSMSNEQILNRALYRLKFGKYLLETDKFLKNRKNKFKWPRKWMKVFKQSRKKRKQILVMFLNIKGEMEPPKLYPIYSSNMVIIQNRPYLVDPRSFWRLGKYTLQIIKGIDRRPVSNLDYDEIKKRGDSTDSDEFLIKAAMQAFAGGVKKKPVDKKLLWVIGIVVVAAVVFFMSR